MAANTRKVVERISARVFCHGPGGGNPVTVFASRLPLAPSTQQRLAQECDWESLMVATGSTDSTEDETRNMAEMAFYMPSGEQVSFCAHAALGGAFAVAQRSGFVDMTIRVPMTGTTQTIRFPAFDHDNNDVQESTGSSPQKACLSMEATFEEAPVSHRPTLQRLLRDHLGISGAHLVPSGRVYPSFLNSSIARPKTLVHLNSLEALHNAKTPKAMRSTTSAPPPADEDGTPSSDPLETSPPQSAFARACTAIDDSTGIYLYANKDDEEGAWEARQFPRASGYPEDPATGIAAAALVASLYQDATYLPLYKIYQGTAMGRPSLIEVTDFHLLQGKKASFSLQGKVEIDSRETIEVDND